MKNYESLYTKYRPMDFDQVIGQDIPKKILLNSISKNKINHAYLFYGIRGTGKTTLARIFSKAINCLNPKEDNNPCNECEMCTSISKGSAFDIIEIDAASNNGVDEIRLIKENTTLFTTQAKYKVYIIDEVHMLTKAAFNALLKTLEEPPKNTLFLLATTELQKIPETVLSRTVVINLEVMTKEQITKGLKYILDRENKHYDDNAIKYISLMSGGSLRDAITSLETVLLYNDSLTTANVIEALGLVDEMLVEKLLKNGSEELIEIISDSKKDVKNISIILIEVIYNLIQKGEIYLIKILNNLINATNTIKDPYLLKISIKTILGELIVPHGTKSTLVENSVPHGTTNDRNLVETERVKDEEINVVEEKNVSASKATNKSEYNVITDYVDINNYMFTIVNNDIEKLNKIVNRWKHINNYIANKEYRKVVEALMNSQPLATYGKTLIVGFRKDIQINEFKITSLSKDFFKFIKQILGEYLFILPVNEENWSKLLSAKSNFELKEIHTDINLDFSDFVPSEIEENKSKLENIFGKDNLTYEK